MIDVVAVASGAAAYHVATLFLLLEVARILHPLVVDDLAVDPALVLVVDLQDIIIDAIETTGVTMGIVGEIEVAVGLLLEAVFTPRTARDTAAVMVTIVDVLLILTTTVLHLLMVTEVPLMTLDLMPPLPLLPLDMAAELREKSEEIVEEDLGMKARLVFPYSFAT
jgi:hypothetical protein